MNTLSYMPAVNPVVVAKQSVLLGGMGQLSLGQSGKGLAIMALSFIGYMLFFVPGIIITIFGITDAYVMACRINEGKSLRKWEFYWNSP